MRHGFRFGAVAIALVGTLVLGGCGDDDDDTTAGDTATTLADDGESAAGDTEKFCTDLTAVQNLEPDIPEDATEEEAGKLEEEWFEKEFMPDARAVADEAPEEVKADVDRIIEIFEEKGGAAFEEDEFSELNVKVNTAAIDLCGAERVDVTATEYKFEGVPAEMEAGRIAFAFENAGKELHEFIVMRKNDGVTESWDQLLELPEGEADSKVKPYGASFGFPGDKDVRLVELDAGDYIGLCFIPVGLTPEAAQAAESGGEEPQGPPHFTQGMKVEFTVS